MEVTYKYKTIAVEHLKELPEFIRKLDEQGKLNNSNNQRYKGYISSDRYTLPDSFLDAKFIIIVARFSPLMFVNFFMDNKKHEIMVPPESYYSGMTNDSWIELIEEKIIKQPGYRIKEAERMPLKLLAVKSGLGKYGRNNICYVDEMGSFISLHGFLTDYEFPEDNWHDVEMMDLCESCDICMYECPNDCIREDNFVIDALKCVTWYNEKKDDFPNWIDPGIHNALLGCMRCQMSCPANIISMDATGRYDDIPEEDTINILNGKIDLNGPKSICNIFGLFTEEDIKDFTPVIKRNLSVLIR